MEKEQGYVVELSTTRRVYELLRVERGRVIAGGLMVFVCMGTSPRVEVVIAHQGMNRKSERSLNTSGILLRRAISQFNRELKLISFYLLYFKQSRKLI